jgi:PiT family inorganic phosphate transporter
MLRLLHIILFAAKPSANTGLRYAQFVTAAGLAFSHGANDAQKEHGHADPGAAAGRLHPEF